MDRHQIQVNSHISPNDIARAQYGTFLSLEPLISQVWWGATPWGGPRVSGWLLLSTLFVGGTVQVPLYPSQGHLSRGCCCSGEGGPSSNVPRFLYLLPLRARTTILSCPCFLSRRGTLLYVNHLPSGDFCHNLQGEAVSAGGSQFTCDIGGGVG